MSGWGNLTWGEEFWGKDSALTVGWGAKSWNEAGTTWDNLADQTVVLSSPASLTALGTPQSFNVEGWSRQQWGNSGWGVEYSVKPTGQSVTSSQGTAEGAPTTFASLTGISTNVDATFPTVNNITPVTLTDQEITSSLGDVVAANIDGWG